MKTAVLLMLVFKVIKTITLASETILKTPVVEAVLKRGKDALVKGL
jgi:hypothetical protein